MAVCLETVNESESSAETLDRKLSRADFWIPTVKTDPPSPPVTLTLTKVTQSLKNDIFFLLLVEQVINHRMIHNGHLAQCCIPSLMRQIVKFAQVHYGTGLGSFKLIYFITNCLLKLSESPSRFHNVRV